MFVAVSGAIACSALTNLDDLSSSDAAPDATDGAPAIDANIDAPIEASASDAGDGAAFCAPYTSPLVYCESFDGEDASALGLAHTGGATAVLDDSDFTSPPTSLLLTAPVGDGGTIKACLTKDMAIEPMVTVVDMRVRIDAGSNMNVVTITLNASSVERTLALIVAPAMGGQVLFQEAIPGDGSTAYVAHPAITFNLADGQWHLVEVVLDLGHKSTTLTIDGTILETNYPLQPGWVKGLFTLNAGITYGFSAPAPRTVHVDDVLATLSL